MTGSIKTYGTNKATSISGVSVVMQLAISDANLMASSRVWGFSFQLPLMKGLRAADKVVVVVVGTKL